MNWWTNRETIWNIIGMRHRHVIMMKIVPATMARWFTTYLCWNSGFYVHIQMILFWSLKIVNILSWNIVKLRLTELVVMILSIYMDYSHQCLVALCLHIFISCEATFEQLQNPEHHNQIKSRNQLLFSSYTWIIARWHTKGRYICEGISEDFVVCDLFRCVSWASFRNELKVYVCDKRRIIFNFRTESNLSFKNQLCHCLLAYCLRLRRLHVQLRQRAPISVSAMPPFPAFPSSQNLCFPWGSAQY
jgi:hypothetical protein